MRMCCRHDVVDVQWLLAAHGSLFAPRGARRDGTKVQTLDHHPRPPKKTAPMLKSPPSPISSEMSIVVLFARHSTSTLVTRRHRPLSCHYLGGQRTGQRGITRYQIASGFSAASVTTTLPVSFFECSLVIRKPMRGISKVAATPADA